MTGVYILLYRKKVVYVGQTTQWPIRIGFHKDLIFTDAKLFECPESRLIKYESRLIEIFNPKYNFMYTTKRKGRKMSPAWVRNNAQLIRDSFTLNKSYKAMCEKAVVDLGYSPRYSSTDLASSIVSCYQKVFNCTYNWDEGKFKKKEVA